MTEHGSPTSIAQKLDRAYRRLSLPLRRAVSLMVVAVLAVMLTAVVLMMQRSASERPRDAALRPLHPPGQDLVVVPESERPFRRMVIGLPANRTRYFMLPSTEPFDPRSQDPHVRFIRRQSYWLNFELLHGRIMSAIPAYTRVFVALPDPKIVPGSLGNEEEVFRDYVHRRVGWSEDLIAERVRFLTVPGEIPFPQDLAEVLGTDDRGRIVLGIGGDIPDAYREPVLSLARTFPEDFVIRTLGTTDGEGVVDIEGGDVSLVWLPEGTVGLIIGRHRVRRYVERQYGGVAPGTSVPRDEIEEAREAFRRAFFGVETIIVGEDGLLQPSLVSEELFHTDMIVNVLRAGGKTLAFVPSYRESPVDAITHVMLAEEVRRRVQYEYDLIAGQLARRGYEVVRLPFADHPVRNPVNVGRFVDPNTGQQCVLLGKYPYHFPLVPGGPIAQFELQGTFDRLDDAVRSWHTSPTDPNWSALEQAFRDAWTAMDKAAESLNPTFEEQAEVYSSHGVKVIPVAIYPTGEGGLHCLSMS
ncbi:MAG: hypothetical protein LAO05_11940 [Acidobacteriia bacterium]|nr:hypothetical protein [Terriglobia bacterium]